MESPVPANVVNSIVGEGVDTLRTRRFSESAMYTLPAVSTVTPTGSAVSWF